MPRHDVPDTCWPSRTLLIDADLEYGAWLLQQLQTAGFLTDLACGWAAARALLRASSYHSCVVMADLEQVAHLEHFGQLRRATPTVWLIVLSHLPINRALPLAHAQGADAVLAEPFSMNDLTLRLQALSVRTRPRI